MTTAASPPLGELSPVLTPYLSLLGALRDGAPVDGERARLVEADVEMWSRPGFDTFLSRPRLAFEPFGYQWQTAPEEFAVTEHPDERAEGFLRIRFRRPRSQRHDWGR
jgi:hypothetical protein